MQPLTNQLQMARALMSAPEDRLKSLESDGEDLGKVAREFESIFMHMMLKSMRKANRTLSEGNYFNSFESEMYEDMLFVHLTGCWWSITVL